jgi:sarcosine oxidase subunit gamma
MTLQSTNMARSPILTQTGVQQDNVFPTSQADSFLVDLTLYAKTGLRGKTAAQLIEQAGFTLPAKPNQAIDSELGTVLRLSDKEYWLLASNDNKDLPELNMSDECYKVFCQDSHAWLAFTSPLKADVMAKLCGVDLRESAFPLGAIAQTVVAGSSAIIVHHKLGKEAVFSILCDRSVAHYVWMVMLDAMDEFNGKAADLSSLSA